MKIFLANEALRLQQNQQEQSYSLRKGIVIGAAAGIVATAAVATVVITRIAASEMERLAHLINR